MENNRTCVEACDAAQQKVAYEYLCHLKEAKVWLESVLKETLPPVKELEENLRNGVYLARVGNIIAPDAVPLSRIYDIFQHRYKSCGLQFKHTDNINHWISALNAVNLPVIFQPETMDLYEKKNMPKVIYCIHALSAHLFKLGKTSSIQVLYGKIEFNREEIHSTCNELSSYGVEMPSFRHIGGVLLNESHGNNSLLQSLILNINNAIDEQKTEDLLNYLCNPAAKFEQIFPENISLYLKTLNAVKKEKSTNACNVLLQCDNEADLNDNLLNQSEIQGYVRSVNADCILQEIENCIKLNDRDELRILLLKASTLELKEFNANGVEYYADVITKLGAKSLKMLSKNHTSREIIENIVRNGNRQFTENNKYSEALLMLKNAIKQDNFGAVSEALGVLPLNLRPKISNANVGVYMKEFKTLLSNSRDITVRDIRRVIESVNEDHVETTKDRTENTPSLSKTCSNALYQCQKNSLSNNCKNSLEDIYINRDNIYRNNLHKIVKIQAHWRGYRARKNITSLEKDCSKFILLRRMAATQTVKNQDYSEQLKLQTLRSSVVQIIKRNQELATRLDEIDIKIGLLVHNKMSIQSIDSDGKSSQTLHTIKPQSRGIKTFNKETKARLDGYRQLFYMLQTDPTYLTRIITRLQTHSSNHIIQTCILSLFNYGSSSRDAYLILRLFRSALIEEVKTKIQKPSDVIKGNPLVLRLALGFSRQYQGFNPLRNILGSFIEKVLQEETYADTNPIDIYRRWFNKREMESGAPCSLPSVVTREQALEYKEVQEQLKRNLETLKVWVGSFLKQITICANKFPYALRFIAKILWQALRDKFPDASEKDIIKIVGNLVFYQYINSAIVAPDTFYIISLPPDRHLKPEQRRNLASIAKILQFAASKKGFGEESKHLMCMNSFIIACHEDMKLFCKKCCLVEDLDDHFNFTKYSEAALIEKPRIYITLEEICECHKILFHERNHISTDPCDPILEVLDSLGDPPSVATLVGCTSEEAVISRAGKTQICLELDNKFQLPLEDPTDGEKLLIETKELILSKISHLRGTTLKEAVEKDEDSALKLKLLQLELSGIAKSSDDYSAVIESLINDISQKQQYEQNLAKEIKVLTLALQELEDKRKYLEDQLSYYEKYLNKCLSSMTNSSKKSGGKKISAKFSANSLLDKGVLVSLEGVPANQIKNVQFEISNTEYNGIYCVQGRFMGVEVDRLSLDVQDLLQQQFEGQPVMNLFGKAKVNVNLLLHLINKKFHARS